MVLLGDPDQLPSIDEGLVLRDLIASGVVPVVDLRVIFRQFAQAGIVQAAMDINAGRPPTLKQVRAAAAPAKWHRPADAAPACSCR